MTDLDPERRRLAEVRERGVPWYRWGPYLAAREWGTVREDYSRDGAAWEYVPHDHARSRAYRWGEDGLLGICDNHGRLCLALALWNERDPFLKERLFGLTGPQGNHGEDVKEYYFFLDNTPTHSYMKALYKYPQRRFPYDLLVEENRRRGKDAPEFELLDTGVFAENRYFDVAVEYAKVGPEDVLARITVTNRGPEPAPLHVLPTLWFRNTWSWGWDAVRPRLRAVGGLVQATHPTLREYWMACDGAPALLFTENESNARRLWNVASRTPFVKDGINAAVVDGETHAVNPAAIGTKAAAHYRFVLAPGATETIMLRLSSLRHDMPFDGTDAVLTRRRTEADAFYTRLGGRIDGHVRRRPRRPATGLCGVAVEQTILRV